MNNKRRDVDTLLHNALQNDESPDERLIRKLKHELSLLKEDSELKTKTTRRPLSMVATIAVIIALATGGVYAAWNFLSPSDVANEFEHNILAEAFQSEDALLIDETKTDAGYDVSLRGIVSGAGLIEMDADVNAERTYAVVAIKKQDGSPMPAVSDGDYGKPPFFVSPLIHGQEPWRYNIASMGGGAATTVIDGVMYRLIECDSIEMFADRGLSLIVSTTDFFDKAAFNYDEATGLVSPNESFDGVNLVFNLPIDPAKADPAKAEQYLKDLWADDSTDGDSADGTDGRSEDGNAEGERFAAMFDAIDWDKATVIESTVKKLTADKDGYVTYDYNTDEYGSGTITLLLSQHFAADQTSVSEVVSGGASDENIYGIRISIDANGGITGAVVVPAA